MTDAHAANMLASRINRSIQAAVVQRQQYLTNLGDQTVKNGNLQGFVTIDQPGEALVTVNFNYDLLDHPIAHFGLELAPNNHLTDGRFPFWCAGVSQWITATAGESTVYRGAEIWIVIDANPDTRFVLGYSFQAQAFTNPTNPSQSTTGAL